MAKLKSKFVCQECGYESLSFLGRCPHCGSWNSLVAEPVTPTQVRYSPSSTASQPVPLRDLDSAQGGRWVSCLKEWDRVLGEGLVPGSLLLLGGSPGIGKSTLILQVAASYARLYGKALYVSGEESLSQIKLRGERLGVSGEEIYLLAEMDVERITEAAELLQPKLVIVDSIQTVYSPSVPASPGSVSQVRECTSSFLRLAKERGTSIILIGHVTKEGYLAGPRVLEHLVDVVLYLEGERYHSLRLLRAVKNRFGSTHEVGLFEMTSQGMREVGDPSEMFLSQR
ncbi:MAG TPA: DNA repair protein RadA, partial [Moorella mulderi]|nr:DNA repair protein RadA [Moorella mulderi]